MKINLGREMAEITQGEATFSFDAATGRLARAQVGGLVLTLAGVLVDVGVDGAYARGQMAFDALDDKRTWELPAIRPTGAADAAAFEGFTEQEGALVGRYTAGKVAIAQVYDIVRGALRVQASVTNLSGAPVVVNGTAFVTAAPGTDWTFEFPTNAPAGEFLAADLPALEAVECGLVGSMLHARRGSADLNVLFLDTVEKWSQGGYRGGSDTCFAYIPAVECLLQPGEGFRCGALYVQPVAQGDPYVTMRDFFEALGYHPATDGIREGVLYSCHPHGTMDADFNRPMDLYAYAKELPAIRALGVDHIWLLPIFEHLDRGVYHPTDQAIIDERYGGEAAMRYFADKAHELGMTVLFDYVPHGPEPTDPLGEAHRAWCSTRRDGSLQDEWHCVSFDMTNPEYLRYTTDMVAGHVRRFGIDGARIDCAMGGLSNWSPWPGHRPSASNLQGGVEISGAIKRGFQEMGVRALNMPENFNPVPAYYPVTDVFYGMNLYRAIFVLEEQKVDAKTFAERLTHFLSVEQRAMPRALKKLRFLGNHDTVSWVWQKRRATEVYGVDWAKAMFALMAFIDGVPMLYQGDEDPALAGKEGPVLRDFFRDLYAARRRYTGDGTEIEYLDAQNGVMAFIRTMEGKRRLVLISMNGEAAQVRHAALQGAKACLHSTPVEGQQVTLAPYAFEIFEMA